MVVVVLFEVIDRVNGGLANLVVVSFTTSTVEKAAFIVANIVIDEVDIVVRICVVAVVDEKVIEIVERYGVEVENA